MSPPIGVSSIRLPSGLVITARKVIAWGVSSHQDRNEAARRPPDASPAGARREPTGAALRALAEAEARRQGRAESGRLAEVGGRGGLDPVRYGDWEINGVACDF